MEHVHFVNFLLFSAIAIISGLLGFLNFISFCFYKKQSDLYDAICFSAVYFIYLFLTVRY